MSRPRVLLVLVSLLGLLPLLGGTPLARAADPTGSDATWATVRAQVPKEKPLFRPTWLPARFRQPAEVANGPSAGVAYRGDGGDLLVFTIGATNTCPGEQVTSEPVLVHGIRGTLRISDCSPLIAATWSEAGEAYSIRGERGSGAGAVVSREELLRVIAGLIRLEPDGQTVSPLTYTAGANCYPQTNLCLAGVFRAYVEAHGGVAVNGYPLTEETAATLEDGRVYQVQYFERVRLEYHPEHAGTTYEVLLGHFGRRILLATTGREVAPPAAPLPGQAYFPETGHNLGDRFLAYWQANGGLPQFGYPISEVFEQPLEDGRTYRVQYFERARFEEHPENPPPYDILLGHFGRRILAETTGR